MKILEELALEAIDHQFGTEMVDELRTELRELRTNTRVSSKQINETDIPAIMKKYTGLTIKMGVIDDVNACVMIPELTREHPLLNNDYREFYPIGKGNKIIRNNGFFKGGVNLKLGRVYGDIAEYPHEIYLGRPFVTKGSDFTVDEVLGIFLHEVGHLMSFYEFLFRMASTNFLLEDFTQRLLEIKSKEKRALLIKEYENAANKEIMGSEFLEKANSADEARVIILNSEVVSCRTEVGESVYDYRGWEMLSDQYVTRLGLGRALGTGLAKMTKMFNGTSIKSDLLYYGLNILGHTFLTAVTYGMWIPFIMLVGGLETTYDDTKKRIDVIRKGMVSRLKEDISPETRQVILEDIEQLDIAAADFIDRLDLVLLLKSVVGPSTRRGYKSRRLQMALEHFAASEMRVAAERLERV